MLLDRKIKSYNSYFKTLQNYLPFFVPFGSCLPSLSSVKNLEPDYALAEIRNGRFPRLILSLHKQFAFNGLNSFFSTTKISANGTGTRAQLLLGFGGQ